MHTLAMTDWVELVRAVGELWRLVTAVAAILALWLLRASLTRFVAQIWSIQVTTRLGSLRIMKRSRASKESADASATRQLIKDDRSCTYMRSILGEEP